MDRFDHFLTGYSEVDGYVLRAKHLLAMAVGRELHVEDPLCELLVYLSELLIDLNVLALLVDHGKLSQIEFETIHVL